MQGRRERSVQSTQAIENEADDFFIVKEKRMVKARALTILFKRTNLATIQ